MITKPLISIVIQTYNDCENLIRNIKFIVILLFSLFIFVVLLKGLNLPNSYSPDNISNIIETKMKF